MGAQGPRGHAAVNARGEAPSVVIGWNQGIKSEANIHLGGHYWVNRRVIVHDMGDISRAVGQRVDGILGEDLLGEYKSVLIDYEHKTLIFVDR